MEGIKIIYKNEECFSTLLRKIPKAPNLLYAIGNLELLKKPAIAIVGSRNSSEYGRKMAKEIAMEITKNKMVVVSGMAVGIDTIAHEACIFNGGQTIAVIASGFDNIYPKENGALFHKIIESGGLVLSEYSPEVEVDLKKFPMRNRIISGLSLATVVVEAAKRSGSTITAHYAMKQDRKVFCVPNSIGSKNSKGVINLIKEGAHVVTDIRDILENLNLKARCSEPQQLRILEGEQKVVFDCIYDQEKIDAEGIHIRTNIDIPKVNEILSILEIEDIIKPVGAGLYVLNGEYYD